MIEEYYIVHKSQLYSDGLTAQNLMTGSLPPFHLEAYFFSVDCDELYPRGVQVITLGSARGRTTCIPLRSFVIVKLVLLGKGVHKSLPKAGGQRGGTSSVWGVQLVAVYCR